MLHLIDRLITKSSLTKNEELWLELLSDAVIEYETICWNLDIWATPNF